VLFIVQPQVYRVSLLLVSLVLWFLLFPRVRGTAARVSSADWALIGAAVAAFAWPLVDVQSFIYRAADPQAIDVLLGALTVFLVLEATRRTVGWVLPATAILFIAYAWMRPWLDAIGLSVFVHRGYPPDRLSSTLYMTLEEIFGVSLDVAATYIILFTIQPEESSPFVLRSLRSSVCEPSVISPPKAAIIARCTGRRPDFTS
jgi:TRAP-type uncharacterized transport system fused permease subunit